MTCHICVVSVSRWGDSCDMSYMCGVYVQMGGLLSCGRSHRRDTVHLLQSSPPPGESV